MTDAERKLWFALRDRRFANWKLRRQVTVGPYVADFLCYQARMVIEVGGGQHDGSARDRVRDRWFNRNGFHVKRFWNNDVLSNLEGVLTELESELAQAVPLIPSALGADDPLPQGEREQKGGL